MTTAKKHHYVPRSILKNFSIDDLGKQINVFDKSTGKSWMSSLMDAGSENHFNTFEIDSERISFESLFDDSDNRSAELTDQLVKERNIKALTGEDTIDLAEIVSIQLLRTKSVRTTQQEINSSISDWLGDMGHDSVEIPPMTDQESRKSAFSLLRNSSEWVEHLADKIPILIESTKKELFCISDNPIVLSNSYPYGEMGFKSPGIEIYFPIASDLTVAFFCPTILRKAHDIANIPIGLLEPELRKKSVRLCYAATSGYPMPFESDGVRFINDLQVLRSSRFLYSSRNDFDFARDIIKKKPDVKNIKSLFTLGEKNYPNMPKGLWLVIYGNLDHYMLPIKEWKRESRFIDVSTNDTATLEKILADTPLVQAMIYEDGDKRRTMREIKIKLIDQTAPQELRVIHNEEYLNKIVEHRR